MGTTASAQEFLTAEQKGSIQRNQQRRRGPATFDDVPNITINSPTQSQPTTQQVKVTSVKKRNSLTTEEPQPGPSSYATAPEMANNGVHKFHSPLGDFNEDDIVFETFYHSEGAEYNCLYRSGERFYMNSPTSGTWLPFPEKWYGFGVLQIDGIIKEENNPALVQEVMMQLTYGQTGWEAKRQMQTDKETDDDRIGWLDHPDKGTVSTYIFEKQLNVHCFFDDNSGEWVNLPLALELQNETISHLVSEVQQQLPEWTDKRDVLAALRASNYDVKDCVQNRHKAGFSFSGNMRDFTTIEDTNNKLRQLELALRESNVRYENTLRILSQTKSDLQAANNTVTQSQNRIASLEVTAQETHLQVKSLSSVRHQHDDRRPKSAVPKQSVTSLSKRASLVNEAYRGLRMEVERNFTDFQNLLKSAVVAAKKLPNMSALVSHGELEEMKALYRKECLQRKLLYNKLQDLRGNIRVFARCRHDPAVKCVLEFPSEEDIVVRDARGNKQLYRFDHVYQPNTSQQQVFEETRPIITSCVDGYNVCIIAYGQTGAGKTFTMMGPPNNPGVNIRAIKELLKVTAERESIDYQLHVSMVEIYNEVIHDLLTADCKVVTAQNTGTNVTIQGLSTHAVNTEQDIVDLMSTGTTNRTIASTKMNSESSRSHLMVILKVEGRNRASHAKSVGTLTLVDLAGSERLAKTEASGQQLVEAVAINRSLSSLGQVFAALGKSSLHVPFRNSMLTQVLQPSLSGDAKAALFLALSPAESNLSETMSTLTFGSNVKRVELGQAKKSVNKVKK